MSTPARPLGEKLSWARHQGPLTSQGGSSSAGTTRSFHQPGRALASLSPKPPSQRIERTTSSPPASHSSRVKGAIEQALTEKHRAQVSVFPVASFLSSIFKLSHPLGLVCPPSGWPIRRPSLSNTISGTGSLGLITTPSNHCTPSTPSLEEHTHPPRAQRPGFSIEHRRTNVISHHSSRHGSSHGQGRHHRAAQQ